MTFKNVVIGEIKECAKHPERDRLTVCMVDVGQEELLQIVCGAPNARVGIKVAVALHGAELPPPEGSDKPMKIKKGKLGGVLSQGMLCSTDELGLADDGIEGIMELTTNLPNGDSLALLGELPHEIGYPISEGEKP